MFQRNKINHRVIICCSDEKNKATYEFVEAYDECWLDIAKEKFCNDFGKMPTKFDRILYEAIKH